MHERGPVPEQFVIVLFVHIANKVVAVKEMMRIGMCQIVNIILHLENRFLLVVKYGNIHKICVDAVM